MGNETNIPNEEQKGRLQQTAVMPRFIGMAVDLSDEAKRHLSVEEEEELNECLPCKAYETDKIASVDGSRLVWLEGSPENTEHYVHKSMLVINVV